MKFPTCTFIFETITTHSFFETIYRLITFKVHIHHSHVTGKIFGYAHDFCNIKIRENQVGFSCIVENRFEQIYKKITTTPENVTQHVL